MGNSPSSSDSEDEKDIKNMDECCSDTDDMEKEGQALMDLDSLFSHTALRGIAAKIKEEIPENVIQQHRYQIIRWLDDREAKSEETVSLAQFCDMLMNKPGVSREDAIRAFQQFDTDGSGVVEVSTILSAIKPSNGPNMMGELGKSIRMLQACSLTPGFVDVYSEDKNAVSQHAERILKYLLRNRAPSSSLPFPYLNGFNNTSSMRLSVLKNTFNHLKDAVCCEISETSLSDGEEVRLLNPCFSSVEVSSNSSDAYRLTNGQPNTFWQSDGAARSHWIRLHMRSNVVIKNLTVNVASSDSSYMPEHITLSAGKTARNLKDIKEVRVPSHETGDVTLLKNAKHHYPIVQININRCRNDGCDTRIHGMKAVGYKVVKDSGISVADSAATWFLQILASTVTAAIPIAPTLQTDILGHSRRALDHIPPLSLSPASNDKPQFLSKFVLQEVERFVTTVAVQDNQVLTDGLHLLLAFNLARGHIGGLLRTLKLLQDHPELTFACTPLMVKMQKARDACWERSGHQLQLALKGCDGGHNDEQSKPENVLSGSWAESAQPYVSEEGKMKVNMIFRSEDYIQLTKLRLKVCPGVKGPRRGLVFVYRDLREFILADHVERFQVYDTWAKMEYQFSVQVRNAGIAGKPDNPVAYFMLEDDCDEIEIPVQWHPVGRYVLIKFLEPRQESAGKLGIVGIKFHGFTRKSVFVEDEVVVKHPPNADKKAACSSLEVVQFVLTFLVDVGQDEAQRRGLSSRPEYLDFSDLPLHTLCALYDAFRSRAEKWEPCALLALQLVYALLPAVPTLAGESKVAAEQLFQHLCQVVDSPDTDRTTRQYRLCRQLIIDGAAVFFADKETRKKQLFSMMQKVETLSETPSVMLVFQSLCQFFSSVDPRGLLDLPKSPTDAFDPTPVLEVMETMVMVTFHEFSLVVQTDQTNEQLVPLLQLVSSLQTSLLAWTWSQMSDPSTVDTLKTKAMHTSTAYAVLVAQRAADACKLLQNKEVKALEELIPKMETSFLGSIVRQMVLVMSYMCTSFSSSARVTLLQNLNPLNQELVKLAALLPTIFPNINSEHWQSVQTDDIVLRTWEVESAHNYENNQHFTQVYSCPGATKFFVDFDQRCETERRYDYLVFTDAKGQQMRFDQKVGTPKWPKQINFAGSHLHFLFHSDSSNNEWGYKFKVTARGSPDMPLCWPFDLQLGLTKLMGRLCGATLNANPVLPRDQLMELEEVAEQDILRSELWTTLFRGGYMIGKLQRSLSGKFATDDSSDVLEFLWLVVNGSDKTQEFLKRCKDHSKGLQVGGEDVDGAVTAVFAALVWHTQQLRDDLDRYVQAVQEGTISDGLYQAYSTAESVRPLLVSQRQKLVADGEEKKQDDVDDPATVCRDKALYLIKFSGLTKVQLKQEMMRSKPTKKLSNRRTDKFGTKYEVADKYPSFRLVLEFVQDQAWTTERVHNMLQERSQHAQAVADVYMISTELVRLLTVEHPFQILIVLFFQEMLVFQDGFSKHYAEGLDGCGLELEARVRSAFYALLRRLTDAVHKVNRHELDKSVHSAYDYIQGCLLHLLDIQWQSYDLSFVSDVRLPTLLAGVARETVKMRDCRLGDNDEEHEVREYVRHMKWFDECGGGNFVSWYKNKDDLAEDEKKAVQMFIARFCDLLEVEVTCNGCNVTLPGRRYRCLQCTDMDLCATCYSGGVKPEKHTDDHDIIHLVYKCNKCQAFVVGMRIHCNVCEDFDLCLGCHMKENLPTGHSASHDVTKIPLMKLKTSQETDSLIQAYIHQHVWMLFTLLAIAMGDVICAGEGGADQDYAGRAAQLQHECITIATACLQQVPDDAEDSSKYLLTGEQRSLASRQQEAFAIHSQERIMGLLGAMVPHDNTAPSAGTSYNFMTEPFLKLLFKISRGESGHEVNTRHLAMGLLGVLLTKCPVRVADGSVHSDSSEGLDGARTIRYLFTFGARCLEKSGLEWACSVARILQRLYVSPDWKSVLHHHLTDCVQNIAQKPELLSIFAMFVMAGFPEVLTTGTLVSYNHTGVEDKSGVVLKHYPDKHTTLVVDVKSRKRHTVHDKYIDCVSMTTEVWDVTNIVVFISIVKDIVETKSKADDSLTVENLWVLSLALKLLHNSLNCSDNCAIEELYAPDFIQCLVSTASKGTCFRQQWLLKDLEVLSLMLYTHEGCTTLVKKTASADLELPTRLKEVIKATKALTADNDSNSMPSTLSDSSSSSSSSSSSCNANTNIDEELFTFKELDEKTRLMFKTLHSDLNLPISVLRAIYDMNDKNPEAVVKAIVDNFEGVSATPKEVVKNLSEKWETILQSHNPEAILASVVSEKVIDTGIHFHPSLNQGERVLEKASEETAVDTQRLIQCPDNNVQDEIVKQRKTKSADLLKEELEKHGKAGSRDYLAKVNMAMAVLYARQVLTSLLAHWPPYGHVINSNLLGCKEVQQIPCVLDLLNKTGSKENFQKVVQNLVQHCEPESLVPVARTACQFMEEVTLSVVTRESQHNYKAEDSSTETIQLPGASFLTLTFDTKCSTREEEDELIFATTTDLQQDRHVFSGSSRGQWNSFQVPGDTVCYKFYCGSGKSDTHWGYKFTVTAGTRDSFETGYIILSDVLSSHLAMSLPLRDLWTSLVFVASKQTGTQRLKTIQLLLKIIQTQHRSETTTCLSINLSLLKPMWQLYTAMTRKDSDPGSILPPVTRALTELFLQVENLAIEWNVVTEYLVAMQDVNDLRMAIAQGIQRIAAVSVMIGYKNLATELTLASLKRKKTLEDAASKSTKKKYNKCHPFENL